MIPITFLGVNAVLGPPRGEPNIDCISLPMHRAHGTMASRWRLTDQERETLLRGGVVELTVVGESHPPVALAVVTP